MAQRYGLASLKLEECKDTAMSPLSVSWVGSHAQEKQKDPDLSAWLSTAMFGETTLWLENPLLVHSSTNQSLQNSIHHPLQLFYWHSFSAGGWGNDRSDSQAEGCHCPSFSPRNLCQKLGHSMQLILS